MASLSFLVNRRLVKWFGPRVVISAGPAFEEAAKTVPAYLLSADILLTHLVFGIIEAGYDYKTSERHKLAAAAASIAGHTLFGVVTVYMLKVSGSLGLSFLCAYIVHVCWNVAAVLLNVRKEGKIT